MKPTSPFSRRALVAAPLISLADDARPIEWVVGYAAGGGSDVRGAHGGRSDEQDAGPPHRDSASVLALEAMTGTPQQLVQYTRAERERWGKVVQANNIKLG